MCWYNFLVAAQCTVTDLLTLSTSLKTRRKLSPANFLRSSSDQAPLANNEANRAGYLDTSSKPTGVLKIEKFVVVVSLQ